ncbi:DUF1552 domain-containing protein [Bremerella sp.]|uniref:DUF1552 domain-containing protein n=1 Tax=Bremerella sp. TaxID=2795602 RepID=UPI0039193500
MTKKHLTRRHVLRGAGVALTLPLLEATMPRRIWGASRETDGAPRRMLCICTNMGMMPDYFWPTGTGRDYEPSEYLRLLQDHREDFTVFSGVSHPDVDGGHHAEISYLTGAPHPAASGFRNSISLDQYAAERIGINTRFPYLALGVGSENATLSWTASGIRIPAENKPSEVYRRMFVQGDARQVERQIEQLRNGRSVLDVVRERASRLERNLGTSDRDKLDQYMTSVRELEQRLVKAEAWEKQPKPKVDVEQPIDVNDPTELIPRTRLMFDIAKLALETDSTRVITLAIDQNTNPKVNLPGVSEGHHSLTHHGHRENSVEQLKIIESAQTELFGSLMGEMKGVREGDHSLLDNTMILYGSNLGNANSHDNKNMPMILAGGGFRHGQYLAFDKKHNYPLPNLYVSMLQRLDIETDQFASATGTMRGLELR